MQAEAGQALTVILARKERERKAGNGVFFWGVGNAPSSLTRSLARTNTHVEVVFSKMKTQPKAVDRAPSSTLLWRQYIDLEGKVRPLPPHALITSRGESTLRAKRAHYALQCFSSSALQVSDQGEVFDPTDYCNAGGTGSPVGASQVTSLLIPTEQRRPGMVSTYTVDMRATLIGSYWVKLVDPVLLAQQDLATVDSAHTDEADWIAFNSGLRQRSTTSNIDDDTPLLL